jgi:DNA-binding NarL/FixJ family response regulator
VNGLIKVLVVDDHPVVREGLVAMINRAGDLTVLGEAGDGQAAVQAALQLRPDVVLMDLRMPVLDGVEATRRLKAAMPQLGVVILTTYDDDELILAGVRAGAGGYLLKDAPREEIFRAIRSAARGEAVLAPSVAARLLQRMGEAPVKPSAGLTAREIEVLELLGRGASNKEIAAALVLSEGTVKTHLSSIFTKLEVHDRTGAVTRGLQLGIIRLAPPKG